MKYQIFIHLKDESDAPFDVKKGEGTEKYLISFKGIFDTIKEGLEVIFDKYEKVLKDNKISLIDLGNYMTITRINPSVCSKWEQLYLNQK